MGPGALKLYAHAVALAMRRHARVVMLNVTDGPPKDVAWDRLVTLRTLLTEWEVLPPSASVEDFEALGFRVSVEAVWDGNPVRAIEQLADDAPPWMMVVGSNQRRGLARALLGSVSEPAARRLGVPTLHLPDAALGFVDPSNGVLDLRRVVVPVGADIDLDVLAEVLDRFLAMLGVEDTEIVFLHAANLADERRFVFPSSERFRSVAVTRPGDVVPSILGECAMEKTDLVVMATHGHDSPLDDLIGSRTERVVRKGNTAVLSLPMARAQEHSW